MDNTYHTTVPWRLVETRAAGIQLPIEVKSAWLLAMQKWLNANGHKWTIDRCKAIRDDLIQCVLHGGKPSSPWIAKSRGGNWIGMPSRLLTLARSSEPVFRRVLRLINSYTAINQAEIRDEDVLNFRITISPDIGLIPKYGLPLPDIDCSKLGRTNHQPLEQAVVRAIKQSPWFKYRSVIPWPRPLIEEMPPKRSHAERVFREIHVAMSDVQLRRDLEPLYPLISRTVTEPVLKAHGWSDKHTCKDRLTTFNRWDDIYLRYFSGQTEIFPRMPTIGHVGASFEPGGKVRYFAAPHMWIQQALRPLQHKLHEFLQRVPWDCTQKHSLPEEVILRALRGGRTVHSVDLSKATDRFPWHLQDVVLQTLFRRTDPSTAMQVELLRYVSRCWWEFGSEYVWWSIGQPLGLTPSFSAFALTHGMMLYALNDLSWDQDFYVLGDDVVILNDTLHDKYKQALADLQVPVSQQKSFSSNQFAQFGGRNFSRKGSYWIPKWVDITRQNILDVIAWWGPDLAKVARKEDRTLILGVLSLPEPIGIGWNPKGRPLGDRLTLELCEAIASKPEVLFPTRTSLDYVQQNVQSGSYQYDIYGKAYLPAIAGIPRGVPLRSEKMTAVTSPAFLPLRTGTAVKGFPPLQRLGKKARDPYSMGSLRYWKRIYKKAATTTPAK